jgi:hypothetical protein
MNCVARKDRVLDIELHVQKGETGVLHRMVKCRSEGSR